MNTYILIVILLGSIATLTVINSMHHPTRKTILKNIKYTPVYL
jgi:hypothetical protein